MTDATDHGFQTSTGLWTCAVKGCLGLREKTPLCSTHQFLEDQEAKAVEAEKHPGPGWCPDCRWDYGDVPHRKGHGPIQPNSPEERAMYDHGGRLHSCSSLLTGCQYAKERETLLRGIRLGLKAALKVAESKVYSQHIQMQIERSAVQIQVGILALKPEDVAKETP